MHRRSSIQSIVVLTLLAAVSPASATNVGRAPQRAIQKERGSVDRGRRLFVQAGVALAAGLLLPKRLLAAPRAEEKLSAAEIKTLRSVKITHYCNCATCTGKSPDHKAYGIARDGSRATWGTVAADWDEIPHNWYVRIKAPNQPGKTSYAGRTFVGQVKDTGGAIKGKRIDIWRNQHHSAIAGGVYRADVEISPYLPAEWGEADGYQ